MGKNKKNIGLRTAPSYFLYAVLAIVQPKRFDFVGCIVANV